ncbi:CARDB domain-containing protein [Nocardioides sp.]|uniref:CARDB domain-containing protein n=1 Tax=Nocardioides sp. TaxID=35761 RepID=UPI0027290147|nr:CARDB domain-containing protein [Nocardioides sp.]MDO9455973.1 CARDB domain-containing protein [Nocardioides sp.]
MSSSRRLLGFLTLVACLGGLLTVAPTGAAARPARPDLLVASSTFAPGTVRAGSATSVGYVVRNAGRARAGRSAVQVDLVVGSRAVRLATSTLSALAPRATRRGAVSARVPPATATGTYPVRVCADVRRQVKESSEGNNCRIVGSLRVTGTSSTPPVTPVPELPTMDPGTTQIDSFAATTAWPADESAAVTAIRARCGSCIPRGP